MFLSSARAGQFPRTLGGSAENHNVLVVRERRAMPEKASPPRTWIQAAFPRDPRSRGKSANRLMLLLAQRINFRSRKCAFLFVSQDKSLPHRGHGFKRHFQGDPRSRGKSVNRLMLLLVLAQRINFRSRKYAFLFVSHGKSLSPHWRGFRRHFPAILDRGENRQID